MRLLKPSCFRPHVWGFFFHTKSRMLIIASASMFSSPCLGILFSQQAWDAPRGGLSMALLRRGFPIDWNSHYFHPLAFCFLRFHTHRRGFLNTNNPNCRQEFFYIVSFSSFPVYRRIGSCFTHSTAILSAGSQSTFSSSSFLTHRKAECSRMVRVPPATWQR